jgi:uncharacterized MAPEG superfamily protein
MTTELWALFGSSAILLGLILLQLMYLMATEGIGHVMGNRHNISHDSEPGGRIQRAKNNLIENLLIFAVVVLIAKSLNISTGLSSLGATLFLISRIAHAITYVLGITMIRTMAWMGGVIGIVMVAIAILQR